MQYNYLIGEELKSIRIAQAGGGAPGLKCFKVTVGEQVHEVELLRCSGGQVVMHIDGRTVRVAVALDGDRRFVRPEGGRSSVFEVGDSLSARSRHRGGGEDTLAASMHSQVVSVEVKAGDAVLRGDTLLVLEAMKMEHRLTAPHDGVVLKVDCAPGEVVERGRVLIELEGGD